MQATVTGRQCKLDFAATSRRLALPVYARRTVREKPTKSPRARSATPAPPSKSSSSSNGTKGSSGGSKSAVKKGESPLSQFMRRTPVLNRFFDGTLLLGDLVMLVATEVSSERIPYEAIPVLAGVTCASWVAAAALMGDYKGEVPAAENWYLSMLGPAFTAIIDSTITWALSAVIALLVFSVLVSGNHIDSALILEDLATENLSPQLEVAVATLVTMSCWRGIAARLRY